METPSWTEPELEVSGQQEIAGRRLSLECTALRCETKTEMQETSIEVEMMGAEMDLDSQRYRP